MEQDQSVLDFREVLWKARRYKWLALFPAVLVVCGAWIYLMFTPPVYESSVVISVDDNTPVSAALAPLVRSDRSDDMRKERVARVDSRVHSRQFLEAMSTKLGYLNDPDLRAQGASAARRWQGITSDEYTMRMAVYVLGKKIIVMPSGESRTRISATDHDPRVARRMAQMIADQLIAENKATTIQETTARGEFSADQIEVYQERLRKSEAALRSYEESSIGRKLTSNPLNDTNYETAKSLIGDTREEMSQLRSRLQTDLSGWQASGGAGAGPPDLHSGKSSTLEGRLSDLESEYAMIVILGKGDLEGTKLRIGGVRQALYAEYQGLAQSLLPTLPQAAQESAAGIALDRAELRSIRKKESRLTGLTSDYSHRVQSSPAEQLEAERLRSEVETNRDLLLALQKEATSSRISAALETSQLGLSLSVVESPQLPLAPLYPDPLRVMGIALFVGPLLGVGIAVVGDRLGAALHTLEQAEREIGVRVIGTIPRIEGWSQPGSYLQRYWPVLSIALVLFATAVSYTLHVTVLSPKNSTESVQPRP